jgi:type II secretory pathway component PulJ
MTAYQWFEILFQPVAAVVLFCVFTLVIYRPLPKPTQTKKAKKKKSRRQRKMEREIFRRAIDAGASEHEARKAVSTYVARRPTIL